LRQAGALELQICRDGDVVAVLEAFRTKDFFSGPNGFSFARELRDPRSPARHFQLVLGL
jgi:hypothetical protein